ncbi:MAG: hypothetical protein AB1627_15000 [Chloroflexota bacterium]
MNRFLFFDTWTETYIELTTPKALQGHMDRYADWPFPITYVTYGRDW